MSGAIFSSEDIVEVDQETIDNFKIKASQSEDLRFRLCLHQSSQDSLHQSVMIFCQGAYMRPHKHPIGKVESYQIIEGEMTVYFFDDEGKVIRTIEMGERQSGKTFFYRLGNDSWHMAIPRTKFVIFHETALGPYNKLLDVQSASWSPSETDQAGIDKFIQKIQKQYQNSR